MNLRSKGEKYLIAWILWSVLFVSCSNDETTVANVTQPEPLPDCTAWNYYVYKVEERVDTHADSDYRALWFAYGASKVYLRQRNPFSIPRMAFNSVKGVFHFGVNTIMETTDTTAFCYDQKTKSMKFIDFMFNFD